MSSVLQSLQYSFHLVNGIGFTQMEMLRFTLKFVFSLMDPVVWSDCLESEFGTSTVWYQQFNLCYVQYGWFSGLLLCLSPCDACLTNRGGGTGLANPWSAVKSSLLKVPNLGLVSSGCLNPMDGWGRLPGSWCSPCPFWLPSTSFFHSMLNSEGGRCCLSLCSLKIFPALGLKLSTVVVASISESLLSPTLEDVLFLTRSFSGSLVFLGSERNLFVFAAAGLSLDRLLVFRRLSLRLCRRRIRISLACFSFASAARLCRLYDMVWNRKAAVTFWKAQCQMCWALHTLQTRLFCFDILIITINSCK